MIPGTGARRGPDLRHLHLQRLRLNHRHRGHHVGEVGPLSVVVAATALLMEVVVVVTVVDVGAVLVLAVVVLSDLLLTTPASR